MLLSLPLLRLGWQLRAEEEEGEEGEGEGALVGWGGTEGDGSGSGSGSGSPPPPPQLAADEDYCLRVTVCIQNWRQYSPQVYCRYPTRPKQHGWWLLLSYHQQEGQGGGELLALKRINVNRRCVESSLSFAAPQEEGRGWLQLRLLSDAMCGVDYSSRIPVVVCE
jgi:hypothetical protein